MTDDFAQPKRHTPPDHPNQVGKKPISSDDDDFWDLGDLEELIGPLTDELPREKRQSPITEVRNVDPDEETVPVLDLPKKPATTIQPKLEAETADEPLSKSSVLKETFNLQGTSSVEKISMAAMVAGLLLFFTLSAFALKKLIPNGPEETFKANTPFKGQFVQIIDAQTYWREPVREGANKDLVKPEVMFIPVAKVKAKEGSNGIVRCFFKNERDEIIGDTVSLAVQNGIFEKTGSNEAEIAATNGLFHKAAYHYYKTHSAEKASRWRILINEAANKEARSNDIKEIARLPIAPRLLSELKSK